jgi:hypothetical protein
LTKIGNRTSLTVTTRKMIDKIHCQWVPMTALSGRIFSHRPCQNSRIWEIAV